MAVGTVLSSSVSRINAAAQNVSMLEGGAISSIFAACLVDRFFLTRLISNSAVQVSDSMLG